MSITFRVSDGQIEVNSANGQPNTVENQEKCSQDVAQCILQDYNAEQNYGSLIHRINYDVVPQANELLIRHYVSEAVRLLDQKQLEDPSVTSEEKISNISKLFTVNLGSGTIGFYVGVDTVAKGFVEIAALRPTSLNHLFERS